MATLMTLDGPGIAIDHISLAERTVRLMRTSSDPLTLDDLAESAGLSPFYFSRIFRSVTGIPPGEFQAALRFERAKELLLTTPASVTEICFEVGYDSLGTFSSRFKRLIGVGPAQFRDMPDLVSGLDFHAETTRGPWTPVTSVACVEGMVMAPITVPSHVYIGLYREAIAATRPIVGQLLPGPGRFTLPQVPPGRYFLMAAALPDAGSPLDHLLPGADILVGLSEPVVVERGDERVQRHLHLRAPAPTDPPLLTALPALLL